MHLRLFPYVGEEHTFQARSTSMSQRSISYDTPAPSLTANAMTDAQVGRLAALRDRPLHP